MLKWFSLLSRDEIREIHSKAVDVDVLKKCNINRRTGECMFYEGGWEGEDGKAEYLPTSYEYDDFSLSCWDTYGDEDDMNKRYFKLMCERFGKEYLADYLSRKTGLVPGFFMEIMAKGSEDKK